LKHTVDLTNTTLLLAAHGSSRPGGDNPVQRLSQRIGVQGLFADVRCGFLKQAPLLVDVLSGVRTPELIVVPMLSGHGFITDELIPAALQAVDASTGVRLCKPIGSHDSIPGIMAERAQSVITTMKLDRQKVSVLVAAHGNPNNPENSRQVKVVAKGIEERLEDVAVLSAFIEEAPLISDWPQMTTAENLIVLPLLIGGGMHGAEDVPKMIDLDPGDPAFDKLDQDTPFVGPLSAHGRSIWFCRTLGNEPGLSEIVLDLATSYRS